MTGIFRNASLQGRKTGKEIFGLVDTFFRKVFNGVNV
jgi:hypothetical protein